MQPEGRIPGKPMGGRVYGSTPHLLNSRLGPSDYTANPGQAAICTDRARDRHDEVWVSEKLDGSCCGVGRIGDSVVALTRAGYLAEASPFEMHHRYAEWVGLRQDRFLAVLAPGQRVVGEWLLQAHGLTYEIAEPRDLFPIFAMFDGPKRRPMRDMLLTTALLGLRAAHGLSRGAPCSVEAAVELAGARGGHGACQPPEGAVWVVERNGVFDFAAKWVRADKVDGELLPEFSGAPPVWNWTGGLAPAGTELAPRREEEVHA